MDASKTHSVVLVDGDLTLLNGMEEILKNDTYTLFKYQNAQEAMQFLENENGNVDIIIADNKIAHNDGGNLLVSIQKKYPNIVRVMIVEQADIEEAQKAVNAGEMYKFLTKPCNDADELRLVVKHGIAQRDLWIENQKLQQEIKKHEQTLQALEDEHPGITQVQKDTDGTIVIDEDNSGSLDNFMKKYFK